MSERKISKWKLFFQKAINFLAQDGKQNGKTLKRFYIFSAILPMISMVIGYICNEVYPFGEQSILCSDLYNQYLPFFADLRDSLKNQGSLFYSWNLGLGSNFLALYAYYLASPFNWLLVFVPFQWLIEFMTILIILKIGLCGLSFSYYLSKHFGKNDFSICIFSMFYALCGFIAAYNWDIMWLDVVALAPLVILGLEELVLHKKWKLYCFSLAASIVFNYYIAMIMCIFLVFYFLLQLITIPKELFRPGHLMGAIMRFAFFSLLAAGMAAVILFPVASALSATKYANSTFPDKWEFYFTPFEAFTRHFMNVDTEIGQEHWPNLYCGVGIFFVLPMYLLAKKIPVRQKIAYMILVVFFLFSFSVNGLAFIWHGLNYPNCLPSRQTFLYDFVWITMGYQVYASSKKDHWWKYLVSGIVAGGLLFLCMHVAEKKEFPDYAFQMTCIFVPVELAVFWLHQKTKYKKATALLAFLILFGELTENMAVAGILTSNRHNYVKDRDSYVALVEEANEMENNGFFRMEMRERKTKNDSMYIGFHSSTMFSSTTGEQLQKFYYELGISSSKVFYWNPTGTPFLNDLLGVHYLFSKRDDLSNPFYHLVDSKGDINLYQYTYRLPLGYVMPKDIDEKWDYKDGTPLRAQNNLVKALGVNDTMMISVDGMTNESGESVLKVGTDGYYYVYVAYKYVDDIKMSVKDPTGNAIAKTFGQVQNDYLLDCGYCLAGTEITFTPKEEGEENCNMDLRPYMIREDVLQRVHERLMNETLEVTSYTDTTVEGKIFLSETGKLVTSIPYEAGWTLYVDGQKTEIELFADTMMAVTLPEGDHEIRFEFSPKGLREGIITSIICWLMFGCLCFLSALWRKKQSKETECDEMISIGDGEGENI